MPQHVKQTGTFCWDQRDSTKPVQIIFFRFRFAYVHDVSFLCTRASDGVPQGSVLGLILFPVYMLPLADILCQCGIYFDCSADDTRLCLSMKPEETEELVKLEACFKDLKCYGTNCSEDPKAELVVKTIL